MASIFQKDCPQCAKTIDVQALRCKCGYHFDSDSGADGDDAQQEQLYMDYLAAREIQAEAALTAARADASADPQNTLKAAQAVLAAQTLNSIRAEIEERTNKTASPPTQAPVAEPVKPVKAAAAAAVPTKPATVHPLRAKAPAPIAKTAPAATGSANKMASPAAAKPKAKASTAPAAPAVKPDVVFQRLQAAKANAALLAKQTAQPTAAPAPKTVEPQKAATIATKPATTAKQECPNCTAYVQIDAKACRCGYTFPTSAHEVPALALDASALALLNDALNPRR